MVEMGEHGAYPVATGRRTRASQSIIHFGGEKFLYLKGA